MANWLDRCRDRILMLDGAMGTQLQARGLAGGDCPEQWAREHPVELAEVHTEYVKAGVDIILTCTFGGSSLKLAGTVPTTLAGLAAQIAFMPFCYGQLDSEGDVEDPANFKFDNWLCDDREAMLCRSMRAGIENMSGVAS